MNSKISSSPLSVGSSRSAKYWIGAALFGALVIGCSDNRICVEEFLAMQKEMRRGIVTKPLTTRPAADAAIDNYLGPYRVGRSDVLAIELTRSEESEYNPPITARVDRQGRIFLPMAGWVTVADHELEDVEEIVRKAYVPKIYRDLGVHVQVIQPETTNVLVTGAVAQPGMIPLRQTERNLIFAIVGAGGVSNMASGQVTLRRIRRPHEEITLNLMDPADIRKALALPPLQVGDIVDVKAATPNIIFVGGLVNAPQPENFPPGVDVTVLQALAGAGGLRTDLTPREATLIRRMPNGKDVHVKLNLDRITAGKDPNITLAAGDVLWVPYTVETRIQEWINQHFFLRFGATANVNYNVSGIEYLNRPAQQSGYYGTGGQSLQDMYDPFGFLNRNAALQQLTGSTAKRR